MYNYPRHFRFFIGAFVPDGDLAFVPDRAYLDFVRGPSWTSSVPKIYIVEYKNP